MPDEITIQSPASRIVAQVVASIGVLVMYLSLLYPWVVVDIDVGGVYKNHIELTIMSLFEELSKTGVSSFSINGMYFSEKTMYVALAVTIAFFGIMLINPALAYLKKSKKGAFSLIVFSFVFMGVIYLVVEQTNIYLNDLVLQVYKATGVMLEVTPLRFWDVYGIGAQMYLVGSFLLWAGNVLWWRNNTAEKQ